MSEDGRAAGAAGRPRKGAAAAAGGSGKAPGKGPGKAAGAAGGPAEEPIAGAVAAAPAGAPGDGRPDDGRPMVPPVVFDPSQLEVLESRGTLCVVAGAGSGKTGTMVEYLLRFIEDDPEANSLTGVLAMTFSEKAAAELRERVAAGIGRRLRAAAAGEGRAPRSVWERELRRLGQAQISTIHGWCLGLVTSRSHLLGLPGDLLVGETDLAAEIAEAAGDLLARGHPDLKTLLRYLPLSPSVGRGAVSVKELLTALVARRSAWGLDELRSALPPEDGLGLDKPGSRAEVMAEAAAFRAALDSAAAVMGDPKRAAKYARLAEAVEGLRASWAAAPADAPPSDRLVGESAAVLGAGGFGRTDNASREARLGLQDAIGPLAGRLAEAAAAPATSALVRLAGEVHRSIAARRLAGGSVAFDDILTMARDLLRRRPEVRAEEAARWRLIMVDEFQDTNRLQTDILAALLAPSGSASDAAASPETGSGAAAPGAASARPSWAELDWSRAETKLKVVGDPKQSIYRFRGAEPGIMEALAADLPASGGKTLSLGVNYRSQAPLVGFFNDLFTELMGEAAFRPQLASRGADNERARPVVWLKGEGRGSHGLPAARQAAMLTAWLGELFSGRAGVLVGGAAPGRPGPAPRTPGPGDVAVLLRRRLHAPVFQEAIAAAGWPCHTLKGRDYFDAPEIRGLTAAYLHLAGRETDLNLAEALLSPLGPVSEAALAALAWPAEGTPGTPAARPVPPSWWFASEDRAWPPGLDPRDAEALEGFRRLAAGLRPLAARRPAGEIVEALVEGRHLLPLVIAGPGGSAERARDVEGFLAVVKAIPRTDPLTGGDQADQLARMRDSGRDRPEDDGAAEAPAEGAVNIMTVHASKGLEFPVVVIPEADDMALRKTPDLLIDDRGRVVLQLPRRGRVPAARPPQHADMAEEERAVSRLESDRLLYVAATRARDHLALIGREFKKSDTLRWLTQVASSAAFEKWGETFEIPEEEPGAEDSGPEAVRAGAAGRGSAAGTGAFEAGAFEAGALEAGAAPTASAGMGADRAAPPGAGAGLASLAADGYLPELIRPAPPNRALQTSVTAYCRLWADRAGPGRVAAGGPARRAASEGLRAFGPAGLVLRPGSGNGYGEAPESALAPDDPDESARPAGSGPCGPEGPTPAAARGTLFHAVMELTDFAWGREALIDALGRLAGPLDLAPSPAELEFLADRALRFQQSDLGRRAARTLAGGGTIHREWPFWLRLESDGTGLGPILLTGVVDLCLVDDSGLGLVVDYKLARRGAGPRPEYDKQMELYLLAVGRSGLLGPARLEGRLWYSDD